MVVSDNVENQQMHIVLACPHCHSINLKPTQEVRETDTPRGKGYSYPLQCDCGATASVTEYWDMTAAKSECKADSILLGLISFDKASDIP